MCGENPVNPTQTIRGSGSPPRVRGKLSANTYDSKASRITPACAGKTCLYINFIYYIQDHPRVCGENLLAEEGLSEAAGSPPRVRGKPDNLDEHDLIIRITPACAGKTKEQGGSYPSHKDHPRVCGENISHFARLSHAGGSPPRVRGKLARQKIWTTQDRITPACAGKTQVGWRLKD